MSWVSSFLHPGRGYDKAQEQLDKYYGQSQGYLDPYNQYGHEAYGDLNSILKSFMDPEALQKKWTEGYSESPSAIQAEEMAKQHGLNAASALGLSGSSPALNAIQAGQSQISMDDRQNYMDSLMQKYLAGAGIAGNIFGQGSNAASQMGQNAMNMGQNSAEMAYGKQGAGGNMFSKLLGAGIGFASNPIGNAISKRWNTSGGA